MTGPAHISQVVRGMMAPDGLPVRVLVRRGSGPAQRGDILTWSSEDSAYKTPDGKYVIWASEVRRRFGIDFDFAPRSERHEALAL